MRIYNSGKNKPWQVLIIFSLLAVILRFFSFFPSVIDHDESTYLEIARMILSGKVLYVDMIDIKPPGLFMILAGFQAVFGHSIFMMRFMTAIWIALTAFLMYLSGKLLFKNEKAAFASGIIYIFFISTWSFYGISLTPEIFFNFFTISALYVLLRKKTWISYLIAGLIAGSGFLVKYFVLIDFAAILLFFTIIEYREKGIGGTGKQVIKLTGAAIGFLIPFLILNILYFRGDHFSEFVEIIYLAPGRYPSPFKPWKMLKFILEFHLLFLPIFLMFYYVLFKGQGTGNTCQGYKILTIVWPLMALITVVLAGKTFGHYTIQLMLPVGLAAGAFFMTDIQRPAWMHRITSGRPGYIILGLLVVSVFLMKTEYIIKKDIPGEIASYLKPKLGENDIIYAGNYHHILYYLLEKDSPTKYIHRSLLISPKHIKALGIDVDEEFGKIIDARPAYIVVENEYPVKAMKDFIGENYVIEKVFEGKIFVYRLVEE